MKLIDTREPELFRFTSDLYLGHHNILKESLYIHRSVFKTPSNMDTTIIDNINDSLKSNGVLIVLGDFGNYNMVSRIKGSVKLVTGDLEWDDMRIYKYLRELNMNKEDIISFFKSYDTIKRSYYCTKIKDQKGRPWNQTKESFIQDYWVDEFKDMLMNEFGFDEVIHNSRVRFVHTAIGSMSFGFDMSHSMKDMVDDSYNGFGAFGHEFHAIMKHDRFINVGTDVHNFKPVDLNYIKLFKEHVLRTEGNEI